MVPIKRYLIGRAPRAHGRHSSVEAVYGNPMVIKISRLSGDLKLSVMTLLLLTLSAAQASAHCMGSSSDCAAHELKESALMQEIVTVQSTENERSGIVVMNANGGDAQVVIESAPGTAFRDVSWSGDGANILFRGEVNGRVGIYWIRAFKLDGPGNRYSFAPGEPRLVVATSSARDPRWSPVAAPDGRQWIAYGDIDAESGLRRIWVVDPNPPHRKFRLSTTNAGRHEDHPTWSPDARRIGIISEPDKKPCGCPGDIEILHLGVNAKTGALEATAKISLILNNPHLGNVADGFRDRLKGVAFRNADWANGSAWIATTANGKSVV